MDVAVEQQLTELAHASSLGRPLAPGVVDVLQTLLAAFQQRLSHCTSRGDISVALTRLGFPETLLTTQPLRDARLSPAVFAALAPHLEAATSAADMFTVIVEDIVELASQNAGDHMCTHVEPGNIAQVVSVDPELHAFINSIMDSSAPVLGSLALAAARKSGYGITTSQRAANKTTLSEQERASVVAQMAGAPVGHVIYIGGERFECSLVVVPTNHQLTPLWNAVEQRLSTSTSVRMSPPLTVIAGPQTAFRISTVSADYGIMRAEVVAELGLVAASNKNDYFLWIPAHFDNDTVTFIQSGPEGPTSLFGVELATVQEARPVMEPALRERLCALFASPAQGCRRVRVPAIASFGGRGLSVALPGGVAVSAEESFDALFVSSEVASALILWSGFQLFENRAAEELVGDQDNSSRVALLCDHGLPPLLVQWALDPSSMTVMALLLHPQYVSAGLAVVPTVLR
jgi:hypothetical protein